MKISIVTVYSSSNYGAFMQAYALQEFLKEQSHQVYFLKHGARKPGVMFVKRMIERMMKGTFHGFGFQLKMKRNFDRAIRTFQECSYNELAAMDCGIFGSDEIWNIKRKNMYNYPCFFGAGVNCRRKIAYAPSANLAQKEDFLKHPELVEGLLSFDGISVRDAHSVEVIREVLGREDVVQVVDPTMLHTKEYYGKKAVHPKTKKPYILIYSYGKHLTQEMIAQIQAFSKEKGIALVSILESFPWCDENLALTPMEFLGYFQNAAYVITDTFHGSIFSIIFNREFVVTSRNSNKIQDLLARFGLEHRIREADRSITDILGTPVDYEPVNALVTQYREESKEFLKRQLAAKPT